MAGNYTKIQTTIFIEKQIVMAVYGRQKYLKEQEKYIQECGRKSLKTAEGHTGI